MKTLTLIKPDDAVEVGEIRIDDLTLVNTATNTKILPGQDLLRCSRLYDILESRSFNLPGIVFYSEQYKYLRPNYNFFISIISQSVSSEEFEEIYYKYPEQVEVGSEDEIDIYKIGVTTLYYSYNPNEDTYFIYGLTLSGPGEMNTDPMHIDYNDGILSTESSIPFHRELSEGEDVTGVIETEYDKLFGKLEARDSLYQYNISTSRVRNIKSSGFLISPSDPTYTSSLDLSSYSTGSAQVSYQCCKRNDDEIRTSSFTLPRLDENYVLSFPDIEVEYIDRKLRIWPGNDDITECIISECFVGEWKQT